MDIILGLDWSGWPTAACFVKISMYSYEWASRLGFYGNSVSGLEIFGIQTLQPGYGWDLSQQRTSYMVDNTPREPHNYLDHTKSESNNCFIIQSK